MENKKIRFSFAAVLFAVFFVCAVLQLRPICQGFTWELYKSLGLTKNPVRQWLPVTNVVCNARSIITLLFPLLLSIFLFVKRRDLFLTITLSLNALWHVVLLFFTSDIDFLSQSSYFRGWYWGYMLSTACASALMVLLCFAVSKKTQFQADRPRLWSICKKTWFVPAILSLGRIIAATLLAGKSNKAFFDEWPISLCVNFEIIYAVAMLLLGWWVINPYKKEKIRKAKNGEVTNCGYAYCSLGKHIVLCLFTCGIWPFIWVHRTTEYLNEAPDAEQYNPTSKLLLCMFVPFYQIYWYYKHGQRIDALSRKKKLSNSDMATLCLILGIFIPIVACIIMQDRINAICTAKEIVEEEAKDLTTEQLKQYKELLDSGVISQEEFDAKKKQLLGL